VLYIGERRGDARKKREEGEVGARALYRRGDARKKREERGRGRGTCSI
jgi:hypothetical protein